MPWVTMVLVAIVAVLGILLLRPDTYTTTAQVSTSSDEAGQRAAVALTALDTQPRVEQAMELDAERRGEVQLAIDRLPQEGLLIVSASASDPRLAALAADTAAALVISQFPDELELATAAPVPTAPVGRPSGWWAVVATAALAGALVLERRHQRWELAAARIQAPSGRAGQVGTVG